MCIRDRTVLCLVLGFPTIFIEHAGMDNVAGFDVDVVGAHALEVVDHTGRVALDQELGKGSHVDDAHVLSAHQIFFLQFN